MANNQQLHLVDQIIRNRFNKERLVKIFEQTQGIFYACIKKKSFGTGMEALKILFENGLKPHSTNSGQTKPKHFESVMIYTIRLQHIEAMRFLYENYSYQSNYVPFKVFSHYFYRNPKRIEALKLILDHSPNFQDWLKVDRFFRYVLKAADVFLFASHGARFHGTSYDFASSLFDYLPHYPDLNVSQAELRRHAAIWTVGVRVHFEKTLYDFFNQEFRRFDQETFDGHKDSRKALDEALVRFRKLNYCRIMMLTGYKTRFCRDKADLRKYSDEFVEEIQEFKKLYSSQPLSLKRLAANVIRTELYPNAVVGSRVLAQVRPGDTGPVLPPQVASDITFGLTLENVEKALDEEWT